MADHHDPDHARGVVDGVDHPVVAGAHPQIRAVPAESLNTGRPGVVGQGIDHLGNGLAGWAVEPG
jgi:hypothetical protein